MIELSSPLKNIVPAIVVSRPGVMRQSLRTALTAIPHIRVVASAGDGLTALNQVDQHKPKLLVIDSNLLEEEVEALLMAVKAKVPDICCLVLIRPGQKPARLLAAGANATIRRDSSTQQWQELLLRLVQEPLP